MAKKSVSDDTYSSMKSMSRNMRPGGGPRISGSKWSTGGYKSGDYAAYRAYNASKMPKAAGEERISPPQKKVGLVGGLGMQAYNSPGYGSYRVNPLSSTEKRNYQYGNVLAPAANKKAAPSVVRATTTEKLSPVKAQPKAPTRVGNRMAMLEKNVAGPRKTAAGKNVSYGFASMKDMARSAGKSIGGMGGGMRSGGGRATDPSRGGMGYSGRGTGSKK